MQVRGYRPQPGPRPPGRRGAVLPPFGALLPAPSLRAPPRAGRRRRRAAAPGAEPPNLTPPPPAAPQNPAANVRKPGGSPHPSEYVVSSQTSM
jgi:hypothetical protein